MEFSAGTSANPKSSHPANGIMTTFSKSILSVGKENTGISFSIVTSIADSLAEAGFVDVREEKFILPISAWPKDPHLEYIGRWGEEIWIERCERWSMALYTRLLGWTYEEVKAFTGDLGKVIRDRRNRFWHEVRVVYARKPFEGEVIGVGKDGSRVQGEERPRD